MKDIQLKEFDTATGKATVLTEGQSGRRGRGRPLKAVVKAESHRTVEEAVEACRDLDRLEDLRPDDGLNCEEGNLGICPYYMRDRGKGIVYCECARFRFPDKGSRREILYRFCAHPEGYKACMIKQALDHYYERKYGHDEKEIG